MTPSKRSWRRSQVARADALRAQVGEAVAFGVEPARLRGGLLRVEQVPVLGHHQEDEPVDEAQKLVEPFGEVDLAGSQLRREIGVGFEETGAQRLQRRLDLFGEPVARGLALARAGVAPAFERAVGHGRARDAEAAAMDQEPEQGEGGRVLVGEDLGQVGFDVRRAASATGCRA